MTLSRAEVASMSKDELVEVVVELSNRVDEVEDQNEHLRDSLRSVVKVVNENQQKIDDLDGRVTPNALSKSYHDKDRDELVFELRVVLCRRAKSSNGKAQMDYNNVLSVFNEHPSDGYAYKLMKQAADYDEDTKKSHYPGFTYKVFDDRPNKLRVDLDAVNDNAVLHAVKNEQQQRGAN